MELELLEDEEEGAASVELPASSWRCSGRRQCFHRRFTRALRLDRNMKHWLLQGGCCCCCCCREHNNEEGRALQEVSSAGPAPPPAGAAVGDDDVDDDADDDDEEASQPQQHRGKQRPSTTTTLCPVRAATARDGRATPAPGGAIGQNLPRKLPAIGGQRNLFPLPNNLLQRSKYLYCVFISTQVASGASMAGPLNQLCTTRTPLHNTHNFFFHTSTRETLGPSKNPVLYCFKSQIHHNIPGIIAYPSVYPIS